MLETLPSNGGVGIGDGRSPPIFESHLPYQSVVSRKLGLSRVSLIVVEACGVVEAHACDNTGETGSAPEAQWNPWAKCVPWRSWKGAQTW